MSNRKFRTNRTEFLYALATGEGSVLCDEKLVRTLVKDGLIRQVRSPFRAYRARRYNSYALTEAGLAILEQRKRSRNGDMRLTPSTMPLVIWRSRRERISGECRREYREIWGMKVLLA